MIKQSNKSKNQRQKIKCISCLVVFHTIGYLTLWTKKHAVYKINSAQPVSFQYASMSLNIVLSSYKVPHKIPPEHKVHLIRKEIFKVVSKVRFLFSLYARPFFICRNMIGFAAVHTWKNGTSCRIIFRNNFGTCCHIFSIKVCVAHGSFFLSNYFGIVILPIT